MAGLLDEYQIDMDSVEAPSFDIEDDTYEFVLGDIYVRKGSKNHPEKSWVNIEYLCGAEGKTFTEWFILPEDPHNPTEDEKKKLGWYKVRMLSLGVHEDEINTFDRDDVVGISGVFTLATKNGFQNIKNLRVEDEPGMQAAPAKAAPKAKAKAAPAPVVEEEEAEEEEVEAPKAAPKAKAKPAAVVANPFA